MATTVSRKVWIAGLVVAMVVALLAGVTAPAGADHGSDGGATLGWTDCFDRWAAEFGVSYECAGIDVPLDYDEPAGDTIEVKMVRIPASDQANKLGSIFLNPGGPGGSGIDFAVFFGPFVPFVWGPEVAARFDIVGFDPRGILRSEPLICFDSLGQAVQTFPPLNFPRTPGDISLFEDAASFLDDACVSKDPAIADHMSTANVARDMDLMRQAVGDEYLNFVGLSYGSYLGVTYANLFPDHVGAVVVDGVLDPVAWANVNARVPFSTALRSDHGAQETLEEFFRQCDEAGPAYCALAPDSEARFDALAAKISRSPVVAVDPFSGQEFVIEYSAFIGEVLGGLYSPSGYGFLAFFLAQIESTATPLEVGQALADMQAASGLERSTLYERYPNFVEGFPGVACSDTTNPTDARRWFRAGRQADANYGYFGSLWTWAAFPCLSWTLADGDAYKGPYTADTANPVLIIGNLYDPATRYEGATAVRDLLPNSSLITVDTPGHTSLGISGCAGFYTGQYLLDPSVAPAIDGLVCDEGINWFVVAAVEGGDPSGFRTEVMDEIAFMP